MMHMMMQHELAFNSCAFSVPFPSLKPVIHASQSRGDNTPIGIQVCLLNLVSELARNHGVKAVFNVFSSVFLVPLLE